MGDRDTYIHTYIYIYTYVHIYIYAFIHTHTYIYAYIYTYTYIHTYIHTYAYTYMHTYIHTYTQTYIIGLFICRYNIQIWNNYINYKQFVNMKGTVYGNRLPRGRQVKKMIRNHWSKWMTKHLATCIYYYRCPVKSLLLYCTGNIKWPTALGSPVNEIFILLLV